MNNKTSAVADSRTEMSAESRSFRTTLKHMRIERTTPQRLQLTDSRTVAGEPFKHTDPVYYIQQKGTFRFLLFSDKGLLGTFTSRMDALRHLNARI